jgi:hypothetical protein
MTRAMSRVGSILGVLCLTAVAALGQQTTTSSTQTKTFEVVAVDGNQLVVNLPEGTREITVPADFKFTVNGQPLSVQQLKPGMKGTAVITTTTTVTPVTVTQVKSGTVMQSSGSSIIVRTDDQVKMFTQSDVDKRGVRIMRDGRPAQISDFRQGDVLTATIITSKPPRVMTQKEVQATLGNAMAAGGAKPAAAATATSGGARTQPSQPMAQTQNQAPSAGARTLPKTASSWPLLALVSVLLLAMGFALNLRRRFVD